MTNLKDKIFKFGIYGKQLNSLTNDELKELSSQNWIEILSPDQINNFKSNFTLLPLESQKDISNSNYYIRMNLHSWRAYLFGSSFITKNPSYFLIIDYLLTNPDYIPCSLLRSIFNIDPKTMHYLCKKLLDRKIIKEKRENNESYITIDQIEDKTDNKDNDIVIPKENTSFIDTSKLVYYKYISLPDQIKMHIKNHVNGIGSRDLNEIIGISIKSGLKHLQRICELNPNEFIMVDSIQNCHTTFKVFSKENLNIRNQKKLESLHKNCGDNNNIVTPNNEEIDPHLTAKDRQAVLLLLANKYGHFIISKPILEEIAQMTGYSYYIDRKNIISNAKEAGLNVFSFKNLNQKRYVVALSSFDESILQKYNVEPDINIIAEDEYYKKVREYFMGITKCIYMDNGYCVDSDINLSVFLNFLINFSTENKTCEKIDEYFQFDFDTVMNMNLNDYFNITRISHRNFLFKTIFDIKIDNIPNIDKLFVGDISPKKINPLIYKKMDLLKDLKVYEFMNLIKSKYQEIIRESSNPFRYYPKLLKLEKRNKISIKLDDKNRIFIKINDIEPTTHINLSAIPKYLNYNSRAEFVQHFYDENNRKNFKEEAEKILPKIFTRTERRSMKRYISLFLKEDSNIKVPFKKERYVLKEDQADLYIKIKKALLYSQPIDFKLLEGYENIDIEDVLEYMTSMNILSGYRSLSTVNKLYINSKFKTYLGELPKDQEDYIDYIYPKIYSIVSGIGSIDFDQIVIKAKYFEPFEIKEVIEKYKNNFEIKSVDGFEFISISGINDPFFHM